jgi:hypothetical protein
MAINKNHEFEELNGTKCAIVEKNISAERVEFLTSLLTHNGYSVLSVPSPTGETFTLGVTDYTFNSINAIFGRALRTTTGQIVTPAYWKQQDTKIDDEAPYYEQH